jgi:putative ABC transport system permease protein
MAQAVREHIPELAVLKTIGFSNRSVLLLVLAESMLLVGLGAVLGLLLAPIAMQLATKLSGGFIQLPSNLPADSWIAGLVLMLVFGALSGLLPALRAMRLNIVDALAGR